MEVKKDLKKDKREILVDLNLIVDNLIKTILADIITNQKINSNPNSIKNQEK
jgi:antitoxin component of RelBE/YafQ-DinJ toxin-antitoxin module